MRITVLGCGASTGVPVIQCACCVCQSKKKKNKRLRASVLVQWNQKHFLVDTSTDLRQQALNENIPKVDAVLYTHPHADHLYGIDELRSFFFIQKKPIEVYGNPWTGRTLKKNFPYLFDSKGEPKLRFYSVANQIQTLSILGENILSLPVRHGSQWVLGYRFHQFAYITDCHLIPKKTLKHLQNLSVLIMDCIRESPHPSHLHLSAALEIAAWVKPRKMILTHLSHEWDYDALSLRLPKGVVVAYDGLKLEVT